MIIILKYDYDLNYFIRNIKEMENRMKKHVISFMQPKGVENFSQFGITLVSAVNEFVDNAIAAGAKNIIIKLFNNGPYVSLIILEDGQGMGAKQLQYALAFGGEGGGVRKKSVNDLGKFHAGLDIASLGLSDRTDIYSNNGNGWVKNYIDKEEIKKEGEIYESKKCDDIPKSATSTLEKLKSEQGLDLQIEKGTIISMKKINPDIIGSYNFDAEVEELFNNTCIRYHGYLKDKGSIYIIINNEKDVRKCVSIPPLLDDDDLLEANGLEIFAIFKYENIISIKDVLPYSKIDDTADITYALIRKKNKNDKMLKAHRLIKLDEQNQGTYIDRNNLNIIRAKKIGYNKKHNSMNGYRSYINVNGNWDVTLGININKSIAHPNSKFYDLLDERLKKVSSHIRKVLQGKECLNPPVIKISEGRTCEPIIIKNKDKVQISINKDNIDKVQIPINNEDIDKAPSIIVSSSNNKKTEVNISKDTALIGNTDFVSGLAFACKYKTNCKYDVDSQKMLYQRNDDSYLIFDDEIGEEGIRNKHLKAWWERNNKSGTLEKRIKSCIKEGSLQEKVFDIYKENIEKLLGDDTPALLVEMELYHNSYTTKLNKKYDPQRMDFCLVLGNKKILIELDGIQHIGDLKKNGVWVASSEKYSEQCLFDMQWQLKGNEIYRISNQTFANMNNKEVEDFITNLFKSLFAKHNII